MKSGKDMARRTVPMCAVMIVEVICCYDHVLQNYRVMLSPRLPSLIPSLAL